MVPFFRVNRNLIYSLDELPNHAIFQTFNLKLKGFTHPVQKGFI